jgi:GGDEF domain-containing protein
MAPRRPVSITTRRILDRREFLERVQEEITRCLRARRHLSVVLTSAVSATDRSARLGRVSPRAVEQMARHLARHVRGYDLVAVSDTAELALLLPETGRKAAQSIVARLCTVVAALPGCPPAFAREDAWGIAMWPADGVDASALLRVARHRLTDPHLRRQA